jgi:hypothetical protein
MKIIPIAGPKFFVTRRAKFFSRSRIYNCKGRIDKLKGSRPTRVDTRAQRMLS